MVRNNLVLNNYFTSVHYN